MYDVLVIGGGPAGSYVASQLASRKHKVLVFEQHTTIGKATCCTGIVGKECLDTFPIGREAILTGAGSATFFAPSGKSYRLEKETPQAYIMNRHLFDSAMAGSAQEAGSEYLLGSRVTDITPNTDSVLLEAETGGNKQVFQGKTAVIASGFGSKLLRPLGLGEIKDFVMGAQAEVQTIDINEVQVYTGNNVAPGFFAWLVPTSPGKALAGLLSRYKTGSYLKNFLSTLNDQGKIISPQVDIKYGGIPLKPLPKTYLERVIVVGDAAGQVKPTTGGGIYYGLLSARAAADTINEALGNNDFSAGALKPYEKRWKKILSTELKVDYYARRMFQKLDDRQLDYLFDRVWSGGIHEKLLGSSQFSFDWHSRLIWKGTRQLGFRGTIPLIGRLVISRLSPASPQRRDS